LFPASQNKTQGRENDMRVTSMAFFNSCLKLLTGNAQSWEARVGLISIIESERLYVSQGEGEGVVECVRDDAVRVLEGQAEGEVVRLALDVLAVLARVDYDVIEPVVGRVLPRLILVSYVPSFLFSVSVEINFFVFRTRHLPHSPANTPSSSFLMVLSSDSPLSFHAQISYRISQPPSQLPLQDSHITCIQ